MTRGRRRGLLTGLLAVAALSLGACAAPGPEAALEPVAQPEPGPRQSYLALGARLLAANEPELAMRAFTTSLSVEGLSPEALTGAGIAAQRQGMLGAARLHLEHARTLAPNSVAAHQNLGMVLMMLKDYHAARTAFRSALVLSGDEPNETARQNLERAEIAIAALEAGRYPDPAATQRVVRLGTDAFRIAERTDLGPAGEAETEAGTGLTAGPERMAATDPAAGLAPVAGAGVVAEGTAGGPAGGRVLEGETGSADKTVSPTAGAAGRGIETEDGTGTLAHVADEVADEAD